MPVVPTTAYSQAEDALTLARALLNDNSGAVFTDTMLLPLLNSAYRGLQRELAEAGVSVLAEQQDIELDQDPTTGITPTVLSDASSPQLPTDCLMPQMLWERATANTTDVFIPMEKFTSGGSMLNLQPSTYLRMWGWREDQINLIGATQSITVRVRYEKVLPILTSGADLVLIRSSTDPLAFATAALAARSRGARALAADLLGTAQTAVEKLIERYIRPEQIQARRIELSAVWKQGGDRSGLEIRVQHCGPRLLHDELYGEASTRALRGSLNQQVCCSRWCAVDDRTFLSAASSNRRAESNQGQSGKCGPQAALPCKQNATEHRQKGQQNRRDHERTEMRNGR